MSRLFQLESFSKPLDPSRSDATVTDADLEATRLKGYDQGYASGWDDAMSQVGLDQEKISEEFARNLRDLGFTYHEARAHVIASLEPLVEELISALFPKFAAEAIAAHVSAIVSEHGDRIASQPIILRVSPNDMPALMSILTEEGSLPLKLVEEGALAVGQAQLVLGKSEFRIDLSDVVEATRSALGALHENNQRTLKHA